jgi:uncharacterized protein (TIGR03067 family)
MYCRFCLIVVLGAILATVATANLHPAMVLGQEKAVSANWEFKVVAFGTDEKENTKKLNDFAAEGWEYVGPIGNAMIAFKRTRATAAENATKAELDKLQGGWTHISRETNGKETTYEEGKRGKTIITGARFVVMNNDGKITEAGAIKLVDAVSDPKKWDYVLDETYGGQTYRSIYRLDGDTFKYCMASADAAEASRPTAFSTKEGDGQYSASLKRAKK